MYMYMFNHQGRVPFKCPRTDISHLLFIGLTSHIYVS